MKKRLLKDCLIILLILPFANLIFHVGITGGANHNFPLKKQYKQVCAYVKSDVVPYIKQRQVKGQENNIKTWEEISRKLKDKDRTAWQQFGDGMELFALSL